MESSSFTRLMPGRAHSSYMLPSVTAVPKTIIGCSEWGSRARKDSPRPADALIASAAMSDAPLPPPELGTRVFSVPIGDYERAYDELGAQTMRKIVSLVPDDFEWDGAKVLDFGSGPGRTLRHFIPMA